MHGHPLHGLRRHGSAVLHQGAGNRAQASQVRPDTLVVTADVTLSIGSHRGSLPDSHLDSNRCGSHLCVLGPALAPPSGGGPGSTAAGHVRERHTGPGSLPGTLSCRPRLPRTPVAVAANPEGWLVLGEGEDQDDQDDDVRPPASIMPLVTGTAQPS